MPTTFCGDPQWSTSYAVLTVPRVGEIKTPWPIYADRRSTVFQFTVVAKLSPPAWWGLTSIACWSQSPRSFSQAVNSARFPSAHSSNAGHYIYISVQRLTKNCSQRSHSTRLIFSIIYRQPGATRTTPTRWDPVLTTIHSLLIRATSLNDNNYINRMLYKTMVAFDNIAIC